jgi:23S rRNA (uracil1939-C5)-methyltransferase
LKLSIEKLIYGGDGLAHLPADEHGRGKAIFLPFVLEGEIVEVSITEQKRGFTRGRVDQILQASPHRIEPRCPYFQRCGGCHYQHTTYQHQLEIKAAILRETLRRTARIELETELQVHASPEFHYRNRSRLKVSSSPQFAIGYYKFNSHELLPVEECPISSPLINRALSAIWQMGRAGDVTPGIQEIELFANADDSQLMVEIYCAPATVKGDLESFGKSLQTALREVVGVVFFEALGPGAHAATAKRLGGIGEGQLIYRAYQFDYRVSAGAFFQTNRHLTDTLVSIATDSYTGDLALDLYAGVGLFSSVLARSFAQVIAVEASPTSYADLVHNSPQNVSAGKGTTELYLKEASANAKRPDLVVVDPPRSGLGERVVAAVTAMKSPRLVYVSCDPATLSRDLTGLLASGYRVDSAHLIDLFPQTYHLESVFSLVR